jgi:hypothetical protein
MVAHPIACLIVTLRQHSNRGTDQRNAAAKSAALQAPGAGNDGGPCRPIRGVGVVVAAEAAARDRRQRGNFFGAGFFWRFNFLA